MKKTFWPFFWIIAVLTTPVALSAETTLPESFKIQNFDRPGRNLTDWVTSFAKFHKVVINSGVDKLLISKDGAKIGFNEALVTLGFKPKARSPKKITEEAILEFIREELVYSGPVVMSIYSDKESNTGSPGLILGYDNKKEKLDIWMLIAAKGETLMYKDVNKKIRGLISYTKPEKVTAPVTMETLNKIISLTTGMTTYDEVKTVLLSDRKLKVFEKEGLSKRLNETGEKVKAVSVTNTNGFEMLTVAMKTSPVILIPQTTGDSQVLLFYKDSKTGDNVCRKLVDGKWVENPLLNLSNANSRRLLEKDGKWSLPILRMNIEE